MLKTEETNQIFVILVSLQKMARLVMKKLSEHEYIWVKGGEENVEAHTIEPPLWGVKVYRRFGYPHAYTPTQYAVIFNGSEEDQYIELNKNEWDHLVWRKHLVYEFFDRLQAGSEMNDLFDKIDGMREKGWMMADAELGLFTDMVFTWNTEQKQGKVLLVNRINEEVFAAKLEDFIFLYENWTGPLDETISSDEKRGHEAKTGSELIGDTQADF